MITLKVRLLSNPQEFAFDNLEPSSITLGQLKQMIFDRTTLPMDYQRVIFAGKELKDQSQKLSDVGISKLNNTVFVVARVLGGL